MAIWVLLDLFSNSGYHRQLSLKFAKEVRPIDVEAEEIAVKSD